MCTREQSAAYLRTLRWPDGCFCPKCHQAHPLYPLRDGRLLCGTCRYRFRNFTGTYLASLRIPTDQIAHLLCLFLRRMPAHRCPPDVGISYKTAHKAYTLFRRAIFDHCPLPRWPVERPSQMAPTMLSADEREWSITGKDLVLGLCHHQGQVLTYPIPDDAQSSLLSSLMSRIKLGHLYCCDPERAYARLSLTGNHVVVPPFRGIVAPSYPNELENFWHFVRRHLTYSRGIPRHHFPLHLKEMEFRFNHSGEDLFPLLAAFVVNSVPLHP